MKAWESYGIPSSTAPKQNKDTYYDTLGIRHVRDHVHIEVISVVYVEDDTFRNLAHV